MNARVIDKYLGRHAEPEQALAEHVPGRHRHALVVPVLGESIALFSGLAVCAREEALVILVVNSTPANPQAQRENAELLRLLGGNELGSEPSLRLARRAGINVLVVDRSSPGCELPRGQGVGLARRIGCDLALALQRAGKIGSPLIATTDADVELPNDYFAAQRRASTEAVALTYPFVHTPGGDPLTDRATELYERWLRDYVEGLRRAGSPYAFHTIGSALAVRAEAYAAVRGFPRRLAGEDFYLVDKLAKLGRIDVADSGPIRIRARLSTRVPFGTGPAVARYRSLLERGREPALYDPRCFDLLAIWLAALNRLAIDRDEARLRSAIASEPVLVEALDELGAIERALGERAQGPDELRLRRRLHTSFGALATLRLVHGVARRLQPERSRVRDD